MDVFLNGEPLQLDSPCTIVDLLERQQLAGRRVAVEVNGEIVPRGEHETTAINPGDRIEVVHALGGG